MLNHQLCLVTNWGMDCLHRFRLAQDVYHGFFWIPGWFRCFIDSDFPLPRMIATESLTLTALLWLVHERRCVNLCLWKVLRDQRFLYNSTTAPIGGTMLAGESSHVRDSKSRWHHSTRLSADGPCALPSRSSVELVWRRATTYRHPSVTQLDLCAWRSPAAKWPLALTYIKNTMLPPNIRMIEDAKLKESWHDVEVGLEAARACGRPNLWIVPVVATLMITGGKPLGGCHLRQQQELL